MERHPSVAVSVAWDLSVITGLTITYSSSSMAATNTRLKRVLVAAIEDDEYVIVNPVLTDRSETTETATEGCLSIPGIQVDVERPTAVTISGQDVSGKPLQIEASDLLARVLQHEVDHLDGVLILDRTDRQSRKAAMREWREHLLAQHD